MEAYVLSLMEISTKPFPFFGSGLRDCLHGGCIPLAKYLVLSESISLVLHNCSHTSTLSLYLLKVWPHKLRVSIIYGPRLFCPFTGYNYIFPVSKTKVSNIAWLYIYVCINEFRNSLASSGRGESRLLVWAISSSGQRSFLGLFIPRGVKGQLHLLV